MRTSSHANLEAAGGHGCGGAFASLHHHVHVSSQGDYTRGAGERSYVSLPPSMIRRNGQQLLLQTSV